MNPEKFDNKSMGANLRSQDPISFGKMLRAERKALGKTQAEIARLVQTRRQTIADLENGRNVGSHILFAMLAALGKMVAVTDARPDLETIRALMDEADDD